MTSTYAFAYSEEALSFLATMQGKHRRQVVNKIQALASNPFPPGQHKVVRGTDPDEERVYRIRSGDYRVLYVVRDDPHQVVILDIDHRKDIYR